MGGRPPMPRAPPPHPGRCPRPVSAGRGGGGHAHSTPPHPRTYWAHTQQLPVRPLGVGITKSRWGRGGAVGSHMYPTPPTPVPRPGRRREDWGGCDARCQGGTYPPPPPFPPFKHTHDLGGQERRGNARFSSCCECRPPSPPTNHRASCWLIERLPPPHRGAHSRRCLAASRAPGPKRHQAPGGRAAAAAARVGRQRRRRRRRLGSGSNA